MEYPPISPYKSLCGENNTEHEAVVRLLIERSDVDINVKDNDGMTALIWATCLYWEAAVRLLIERNDVEINAKDDDEGNTALVWAAEAGYESIVRLINDRLDVLARGSDIAPGGALAGGVAGVEGEGAGGGATAAVL